MGKKAAEARKESVWKIINKEKKRRKRMNMCRDRHGKVDRVFHEYFMRLLGGVEH